VAGPVSPKLHETFKDDNLLKALLAAFAGIFVDHSIILTLGLQLVAIHPHQYPYAQG